jgi:hypothetical protein
VQLLLQPEMSLAMVEIHLMVVVAVAYRLV